ncbi:MAG TPA: hypothetical protein VM580_10095 [Labilithrix sp.]|nr:hypothetical protein [Labilithrix sp.]
MFCPSCRLHVSPVPPRSMWKIVSLALWISSLTVATGFSLLAGLNLVLAPAAVIIGMSVGTAARRLNCFSCPVCSSELYTPEPIEDALPPEQGQPPRELTPAAAT